MPLLLCTCIGGVLLLSLNGLLPRACRACCSCCSWVLWGWCCWVAWRGSIRLLRVWELLLILLSARPRIRAWIRVIHNGKIVGCVPARLLFVPLLSAWGSEQEDSDTCLRSVQYSQVKNKVSISSTPLHNKVGIVTGRSDVVTS
jgi:hypothetical protein